MTNVIVILEVLETSWMSFSDNPHQDTSAALPNNVDMEAGSEVFNTSGLPPQKTQNTCQRIAKTRRMIAE